MTTAETIERLRDLQTIDNGIRAAQEELERLPKRLEAARQDHAAVDQKLGEAQEGLNEIVKQRRATEQQIADVEQQIVKFENDKLKVKTNEEFRALNHQIEAQQKAKSELETQVLLGYDEEETASGRIQRLKEELALVARTVEQREEELRIRAAEDKNRLVEFKARREELVVGIEARTLSRYETLVDRKGGVGVVPVARGACGGCHTQQPPQKLAEVKKGDTLHNCDFCGRFLIGEEGSPA